MSAWVGTIDVPIYVAARPSPSIGTVIVLHEAFGLNQDIMRTADRFADAGFVTLAPHLHYRVAPQAVPYDDVPLAVDLVERAEPSVVVSDISAVYRWAATALSAPSPVFIVGYCFGGAASYLAAGALSFVSAAVAFYPVGVQRYALTGAPLPRCPLLVLFGDQDEFVDSPALAWLAEYLADAPDAELKLYPGAGHAFANDGRPELYARESAEAAWADAITFLGQHSAPASA
jgi:carboxymethylenebutenolidase